MSIQVFNERQFEMYDWVYKPTNVTPADGATDIGETPTLELDGYYNLYGFSQNDSQFQVSTASDFNTTVVDVNNGANITYQLTSGNLSTGTEYYWRGRTQDDQGNWSEWSNPTSFTTASAFKDYSADIGTSTDGGYNAGTISYNSNTYAIIVAPGASGESSKIEWSSDTSTSYGCTDSDDGVSNTTCMLNNDTTLSSETAANFIDGIQTNGINGYNDWYIPAINELQLMYDNMYAPSADLSGTDWDSDGETYQSSNYWSSTEHSSTNAKFLDFNFGNTADDGKSYNRYVRAVRRVQL